MPVSNAQEKETATDPKSLYSGPSDQLAVVEFNTLQVVTADEMVQCHISKQRTVVQLKNS